MHLSHLALEAEQWPHNRIIHGMELEKRKKKKEKKKKEKRKKEKKKKRSPEAFF